VLDTDIFGFGSSAGDTQSHASWQSVKIVWIRF
jgi:hypothetical protein